MKKIFSILLLTSVLVLPAMALAIGPSEGVPSGLSSCAIKHDIKGCSANMADPETAGAVTNCQKGSIDCNAEACCILDRIFTVADWIFVILIVVSALFIIWGAFSFVLSGGDAEKVTGARNRIIWAIVGVVIAFLSQGIVRLIVQIIKK